MTSFKTRVIGAVILVSLAVIFVPMLFKSPATTESQRSFDTHEQTLRPQRNASQPEGGISSEDGKANGQADYAERLDVPDAPEIPEFTIEQPVEPSLRKRDLDADIADIPSTSRPAESSSPERASSAGTAATAEKPPTAQTQSQAAEPAAVRPPVTQSAAATSQPASASETDRFGEAWTIQIGAFSDRARAQKISSELQKSGTTAYLQDIQTAAGVNMVRVYAGPMLARDSAEKLKSSLDKQYGVNSLIMRYRPVQP